MNRPQSTLLVLALIAVLWTAPEIAWSQKSKRSRNPFRGKTDNSASQKKPSNSSNAGGFTASPSRITSQASQTSPAPAKRSKEQGSGTTSAPSAAMSKRVASGFQSNRRSNSNAVQVIEEATKVAKPDAQGRIAQPVQVGGKTMIRRKYSDEALDKIVDAGVLTKDQARRANEIGRTKVDRLMETVGAGAILGASDKEVGAAIESELKSKGANPVAGNSALVDSMKKNHNLPNITGADASIIADGIGEMKIADMDPSSAQNWKNFNQFKLGKMTGQEVLDRRVRADGSKANPSGPKDGPTAGGGSGNDDPAASGTPGVDVVIGGFQPVGGSPFGGDDQASGDAGGSGSSGSGSGGADQNGDGSGSGASGGSANEPGAGTGTGGGSATGSGTGTGASSGNPQSPAGGSVQPDGDPDAEESDEESYSPTAVVTHNEDGTITVDYYEPNSDTLDNEHTGSETYTPDGDGNYTGDQGGKLKGKPPEGNYEYDNDPNSNSFRYQPEEENKNDQKSESEQDSKESDESAGDSNSGGSGDAANGGDQGYTPNHDDGLPAATAENLAWAQARQAWIEGGLKNPGDSPAGNRPADQLEAKPATVNPRQGWAINPGPGGGMVQPTVKDWNRKFGGIGVADPPKPVTGGTGSTVNGPAAGPTGAGPGGTATPIGK